MALEDTYPALVPKIRTARDEGHSDEEISQYIRSRTREAFREGYSTQEVETYLGEIKRPSFFAARGVETTTPGAEKKEVEADDIFLAGEPHKEPVDVISPVIRGIKAIPGTAVDIAKHGIEAIKTAPQFLAEVPADEPRLPKSQRIARRLYETPGELLRGFASGATAGLTQEVGITPPPRTEGAQALRTIGEFIGFPAMLKRLAGKSMLKQTAVGAGAGAAVPIARGEGGQAIEGATTGAGLLGAFGLAGIAFQRFKGRAPTSRAEIQKAIREEPAFVEELKRTREEQRLAREQKPKPPTEPAEVVSTETGGKLTKFEEALKTYAENPDNYHLRDDALDAMMGARGIKRIKKEDAFKILREELATRDIDISLEAIRNPSGLSEQVKVIKPPKERVATENQSAASFLENSGGISITRSPKEAGELRARRQSPKGKRFIKAKAGLTVDEAAQRLHEAGFIEEPSARALLEALDSEIEGRPVFSVKGAQRERRIELEAERELAGSDEIQTERAAEAKIGEIEGDRPLEFEGKKFDEAERVPGGVRLKDDVDVTLTKADDILRVEEVRPTDLPVRGTQTGEIQRLERRQSELANQMLRERDPAALEEEFARNEARLTSLKSKQPSRTVAKRRIYDEVQREIDQFEDRLEARGVDTVKTPLENLPKELRALYDERDAIGAQELKQSIGDLKGKLAVVGIKGQEADLVLKSFAIDPKRTDVFAQSQAAEYTQRFAQDVARRVEDVAIKLAIKRGEQIDLPEDVSPQTVKDARKAVDAVRSYFGLETAKPMFERTEAGMQGVIPGAEGREIPRGAIRAKGRQAESLTELERGALREKEPGLFEKRSPAEEDVIPFDVPESGLESEPGSFGMPAPRKTIFVRPLGTTVQSADAVKVGDVVYDRLLDRAGEVTKKFRDSFQLSEGNEKWTAGIGNRLETVEIVKSESFRRVRQPRRLPITESEVFGQQGESPSGSLGFPSIRARTPDIPQSITPTKRNFRLPVKGEEPPIVGRGEMIRYMQEQLEVPIRVGHGPFKQMKAAGFFKVQPEVIRLEGKFATSVEVASHEVGHFLSKRLMNRQFSGAKRSRQFDSELQPLGKALYGNRKPPGGYAEEGIAEFARLYITDPAQAQAKAPRFFEHFEDLINTRFTDVRDVLLKTRADYKRWREMPSVQKVLSQISVGEKAARTVAFDDFYTAMVDDLHPLKIFTDRMTKGQPPIKATEDPYTLGRLTRGWMGKADVFLNYGTRDFNTFERTGPALREILQPTGNRLADFRAYLVARRSLELQRRGKETGIAPSDAAQAIKDLDSPTFQKAAQELYAYQDKVLDYLKDAGFLTDQGVARMRELNQNYVPFYRLMETQEPGSLRAGTGRTFANLWQPVKRIKGSGRTIQDPLESVIKNTYTFLNLAERNSVGKALAQLAERTEGAGKYVEEVPKPLQRIQIKAEEILQKLGIPKDDPIFAELNTPEVFSIFRPSAFMPKSENMITVWRGGERKLYQLHPDLYRAVNALDRESANLFVRILRGPARTLRLGATGISPEFVLRNPARDQISAYLFSKYGYVPVVDWVRGLFHVLRRDELYQQWKMSGGEHSALVSLDRPSVQKMLQEMTAERFLENRAHHIWRHPIDTLRIFSELGEASTRIGEFARGMAKEGQGKEAALRSGFAAREVTLDFARMGAGRILNESLSMQSLNQVTAFLNANIQGIDKIGRAFKQNPQGTLVKALTGITVPSILLYLANMDDARYEELPSWQKNLFWIVPTGHVDRETWGRMTPEEKARFNEESPIWRIPKPFDMGMAFGTAPERILDWVRTNDPEVLEGLRRDAWEAGPPIIPTAFVPLFENMANWSMFRQRRIVPRGKEDVEPAEQFTPFTSEFAKRVGREVGYSPAKIENLVRGYFGGAGQAILEGGSALFPEATEKPAQGVAGVPGVRGFVARFPGQPESIERFYDALSEARQKKATFDLLRRERRIEEARDYLRENRAEIVRARQLERFAGTLTVLRKQADRIRRSELSPQEKRRKLEALTFRMTALARRGLTLTSKIRPKAESEFSLANQPGN